MVKIEHVKVVELAKRDDLFANISSYKELYNAIRSYSNCQDDDDENDTNSLKGEAFEVFAEYFLNVFGTKGLGINNVKDTSNDKMNKGYDFSFVDNCDRIGLIQVKFRSHEACTFKQGTFSTLKEVAAFDFRIQDRDLIVLFTNTITQHENLFHNEKNLAERFRIIDRKVQENYIDREFKGRQKEFWSGFWSSIQESAEEKNRLPPPPSKLYDHQQRTLDIVDPLLNQDNFRGQVICATGGGKTRIECEIIKKGYNNHKFKIQILVAPTIDLLIQHDESFNEQGVFLKENNVVRVHFRSGKEPTNQNFNSDVEKTTNKEQFIKFYENNCNRNIVIFVTYKSYNKLFQILEDSNIIADLCIWDEFHHLANQKEETKEEIKNFYPKRNLFFSASQKRGRIFSTFDENLFGKILINITYGELVQQGILVPKIKIVYFRTNSKFKFPYEEEKEFENAGIGAHNIEDAHQEGASAILAMDYLHKKNLPAHIVTFSSSVAICKLLAESPVIKSLLPNDTTIGMVCASTNRDDRKRIFDKIGTTDSSVIFQHSIMKEGIDNKKFNSIILCRNMEVIGIQQAIGRAVRIDPEDRKNLLEGKISIDSPVGWKKYTAYVFVQFKNPDINKPFEFEGWINNFVEKLMGLGLEFEDYQYQDFTEARISGSEISDQHLVSPEGNPEYSNNYHKDCIAKAYYEYSHTEKVRQESNEVLFSDIDNHDDAHVDERQNRIDKIYKNNGSKPVCVKYYTLGKELINRIPIESLNKQTLIVNDLGLLMAHLVRLKENNISFENVYYGYLNEQDRDFTKNVLGVKVGKFNPCDENFSMDDDYNFIDMKFDVIVGNPPYNGIKRNQCYEKFDRFLETGYQTYFPFIAMGTELLTDDGLLSYIVPNKWLNDKQSTSLRDQLFLDGKLLHSEVIPQPKEWKDVKTHSCSIFVYQKNLKEHTKNVFQIDNRIANCSKEIDSQILSKIYSIGKDLKRIECFGGMFGGDGTIIDINSDEKYCVRYGEIKSGKIKISKESQQKINSAIKLGQKFLIYPDFQNAPFKITGKLKARTQVRAIDPMPCHDTIVIVPTTTPQRTMKFLESNVAKFVWTMFFSQMHFAKTLTNVLPDFSILINDDFSDQDLYKLIGLTDEEIVRIEEIAKDYGKCL